MERFIALRYLKGKHKLQFISIISYISAGGVLLGTCVLVVALSIANGFEKEVRDRIVGMFAHARVSKYFNREITDWDSLRRVCEAHEQVVAASPYINGKAVIEKEDIQEGVQIFGIHPELETKVSSLDSTIIMGTMELDSVQSKTAQHYPGIIVGLGLANKLGIRPGDEVVLMTVAAGGEEEALMDPMSAMRAGRYTVSGVFESGMYEYDQNLVYISLSAAQALFGIDGAEGIAVRTKNIFQADKLAPKLTEYLGGYPYRTVDWKTRNKSLFKWMNLERLIIFIVISLIIVVAAFNIISSLIMIILEKRREIGILMGMGATSRAIMKIFMLNGVFIGLIGSTIGTSIGVVLCWLQYHYNLIPLPGDVYFITTLPVLIRPLDAALVFVSANVICFLATIYPALAASRIMPAEAIRID
jgi:lipoprotein-releasing system permease protein